MDFLERPGNAQRGASIHRDESNMHIDLSLPYELLALETALAACTRGLEAEASEVEVCLPKKACFTDDLDCFFDLCCCARQQCHRTLHL